MGVELFHADGRTHMTKLIVAFRNFANVPKNCKKKLTSFEIASVLQRAGLRGGPAGQLAGASTYNEAPERHLHNRKSGSSKFRHLQAKKFLRKLSALWARGLKNFLQLCIRPKKV
jgi:hypothetical protein